MTPHVDLNSNNFTPAGSPRRTGGWRVQHTCYLTASVIAVGISGLLFWRAISTPPEVSRRLQCKNNLHQIGLALHSYHDAFGSFPPAYIADATGRPMHSWRVLLLPFLGQSALYGQYDFDEPWDGPHNRLLHEALIPEFKCPTARHAHPKQALAHTSYVAIVGPGTAWPADSATSYKDFRDGMSLTLHVVEVADSGIHWMEPRDLHTVQMSPEINSQSGQGISSKHTGGAQILFADGTVRYVFESLSADTIRALLTISGHEVIPDGGF